ncbi:BLOC1S2 [Cordylochernes scorpioides]|uniref:BLOC1S2 n=1 Tax=Cordylochernes scorpioides TaxID=51811 RepID=A0ABY6LAE1_9ARAC|nr:BLOC1S2 [Cordylochernes scorpioides]
MASSPPDEAKPDLTLLATLMFEKTADYLKDELTATTADYQVLEDMNKVAITKYTDMKQIAQNVGRALQELDNKYATLKPYLDHIDQVEDSVAKLEQVAYKLDAYSKRLEAKFKALEKR